jgi:hypothetical protein
MPTPLCTENWLLSTFTPGQSATRVFDISGVPDFGEAYTALVAQMSVDEGSAYPIVDIGEPMAVPTGGISYAWNGRMVRVTVNYGIGGEGATYETRKWVCRMRILRDLVPAGETFQNSNFDPLNVGQQPTKPRFTIELELDRYETGSGFAAKAIAFNNKVHNGASAVIFPVIGAVAAPKLLCKGLEIVDDFTSGSTHLLCRYTFQIRDALAAKKAVDGSAITVHDWQLRIPDVGYLAHSSDDESCPIVYANGVIKGQRVSSPVFLNGKGALYTPADYKILTKSGTDTSIEDAAEFVSAQRNYIDTGSGILLLWSTADGEADLNTLNIAANV